MENSLARRVRVSRVRESLWALTRLSVVFYLGLGDDLSYKPYKARTWLFVFRVPGSGSIFDGGMCCLVRPLGRTFQCGL